MLQKRIGLAIGIYGDAGIGKSHQVKELLQTLPCRNLSVHATSSLVTVVQSLPKPKKLPLWAESNVKRLTQGEAVESSSILDSLAAILSGLTPFVLHLEDIHEADSERLEFITSLARMLQRIKGVALLVTSRKEPPEPFTNIKLVPLSPEDSELLLERELKNNLPKDAMTWIYEKAAGNPLYTLEYLRYLTRQGFLWSDGKSWHWRKPEQSIMPVTVEALIEQLLNQARTEALQTYVLETKAFLPLETHDETWQRVARVNHEELQTAITELTQRGIFKNKTFAHPLFREVTLKTLSPERKRNLARRAMNVLQDKPELAVLFIEDAKLEAEKALKILEKTAQLFENTGRRLEASKCLEDAIKYALSEDRGKFALRAAHLSFKAGDDRVFELAQQAIRFLGETDETLQVLVQAHAVRGERSEVRRLLPRFQQPLNQTWLTQQLFVSGAYDDLEQLLSTSLNVEELSESSMYHIGYFLMDTGRLREALELVEGRLKRPDVSVHGKGLLQDIRASVFYFQGNYQQAEIIFSEVIELDKEANTVWDGVANTLRSRAFVRMEMGLYREVLPDFQEALKVYAERGRSVLYAETLSMMSEVYLELAETEKALELLTESLEIFSRIQVQSYHVNLFATLANLYIEHPTSYSAVLAPKYANSALSCAVELKSTLYEASAKLTLSRVYHFTNQFELALSYADEALHNAEQSGFVALTIEATTARALALNSLGEHNKAQQLLQSALQTAAQHGMVFKLNKIGLELDRLNNDIESARKRMKWFEERGLMNGVNIAKRYFPELAEKKKLAITESNLRLEVLGPLQVTGDKSIPVRGQKRQQLLAQLLEARLSGRTEVPRLSLLDALYPEEDELKAGSNLKGVVHVLRESFGDSFITTTHTGYALGACTSDAEQFLQTGDSSLWRGSYLEGLNHEESSVQDSLYLALFEKTTSLLETNPKEAARVGEILVEAEPYNLEYLKRYLAALRLAKNHSKLTRHYHEAQQRMLEVGETLPENWLHFLA